MTRPNYSMRPICDRDLPVLRKMWDAYLQELANFDDGVEVGMEMQDIWWTKPGELHGTTLLVSEQPVGFVLVMGKRWAKANGESTDFHVYEMYVEPEQRGTELAPWAAQSTFNAHPGSWSLHASRLNERALRFWRRVLADPNYATVEGPAEEGKLSFHFHVPAPAEDCPL